MEYDLGWVFSISENAILIIDEHIRIDNNKATSSIELLFFAFLREYSSWSDCQVTRYPVKATSALILW